MLRQYVSVAANVSFDVHLNDTDDIGYAYRQITPLTELKIIVPLVVLMTDTVVCAVVYIVKRKKQNFEIR